MYIFSYHIKTTHVSAWKVTTKVEQISSWQLVPFRFVLTFCPHIANHRTMVRWVVDKNMKTLNSSEQTIHLSKE